MSSQHHDIYGTHSVHIYVKKLRYFGLNEHNLTKTICPYFIIALTPSVESIKKPVLPKAQSAQMPKNNALCTEIREPEVARQLIILIS